MPAGQPLTGTPSYKDPFPRPHEGVSGTGAPRNGSSHLYFTVTCCREHHFEGQGAKGPEPQLEPPPRPRDSQRVALESVIYVYVHHMCVYVCNRTCMYTCI